MALHFPSLKRLIVRTLLGLLLICVLLAVAGALFWQQFKREQGIRQLDWQDLRLGVDHLSVERLTLLQENAGGALDVTVDGLRLDWRLAGGPSLHTLRAGNLVIDWRPAPAADESTTPSLKVSRPDPRELLPDWLPSTLEIGRFDLSLPCATGRCALTGQLALRQGSATHAPLGLLLTLAHEGRELTLDARVSGPPERVDLAAQVQIDGHTRLSLTSLYHEQPAGGSWSGHLQLPALPEAAWLLGWLEDWSGPQPGLQNTGELQARADWDWQLEPGPLDAAQLRSLDGHLNLEARLPSPWPVPGVGQVQGNARVQVRADDGRWSAKRLHADLQLTQLEPALLGALPAGLQPAAAHLNVQQRDLPAGASSGLPLQLQLDTRGALQLHLQAEVHVDTAPRSWSLRVDSSRIRASVAHLQLPALEARALQLDMQLDGRLDAGAFAFTLDEASRLTAEQLLVHGGSTATRLGRLRLDSAALAFSGTLPIDVAGQSLSYRISGPVRLRSEQIVHPMLQPLGWTFEGQLQADSQHQQLAGTVSNGASLSGALDVRRTVAGLDIDFELPDHFLRGGNPLVTLGAWPQALELSTGRLQLAARLSLPAEGPLRARGSLQLKGVGGLHDRTEFSGLDTQLDARLEADRLHLQIRSLTLQQANPGLIIGPLQFVGEYRAALAKPAQGQLTWASARSALLGGEVWLEPGALDLKQTAVLPVRIRGLQLQELFRAYPAEGLSGQGALDGELPVGIGPKGLQIVGGYLAAREPGGRLQFSSPKISALGRSNPAMQVVAEALEDFHYNVLSTGVDYDAQGTLRLALKLKGRNPDVERGRPINFSINLEEDIPALLTSLQLTERVSERVRERVQRQLERSRTTP